MNDTLQGELFAQPVAAPVVADGLYAEVVFDRPLDHAYTYAVPRRLQPAVAAGKRVVAPFGRGDRWRAAAGARPPAAPPPAPAAPPPGRQGGRGAPRAAPRRAGGARGGRGRRGRARPPPPPPRDPPPARPRPPPPTSPLPLL